MRFLRTLETKSFLIGFKTELPSPTVNPEPPFFIGVTASALGEGHIAAIPMGTIPALPPRLLGAPSPGSWSSHTKFRDTALYGLVVGL